MVHYCGEGCQSADAERHNKGQCSLYVKKKRAEKLEGMKAKLMAGEGSPEQRLVWAGELGYEGALLSVLTEGMSVDSVDEDGETATMAAACWGHVEALRILLGRKANVNLVDNRGNSALIVSASWGNLECVELLLAASADLEIASKYGKTALLTAAQENQPKASELLINDGCKGGKR